MNEKLRAILLVCIIFLCGVAAGLIWAKVDMDKAIEKAMVEHGGYQALEKCKVGLEDAVELIATCQESKKGAYELYEVCDDTLEWMNRLKNEYKEDATYCWRQMTWLGCLAQTACGDQERCLDIDPATKLDLGPPTPTPEPGGNT